MQPWEGALGLRQALEGQQEPAKHRLLEKTQQKRVLKQQKLQQ